MKIFEIIIFEILIFVMWMTSKTELCIAEEFFHMLDNSESDKVSNFEYNVFLYRKYWNYIFIPFIIVLELTEMAHFKWTYTDKHTHTYIKAWHLCCLDFCKLTKVSGWRGRSHCWENASTRSVCRQACTEFT